jgi:branched-chain amino acid transport system permease protein
MSSRRARAIVIVISTLTIALLPLVVQDRFLLKIFTFVGLNALVVVGISLLFGYAGQVSLGHAGFVGLGAYTAAFLVARLDLPWLLAMVAAGLVTALGGMVLAVPSLRLKGHYLAMATLGFGELMTLGFKEADFVTGGVNGFSGVPFPSCALRLDRGIHLAKPVHHRRFGNIPGYGRHRRIELTCRSVAVGRAPHAA